MQGKVCAEQLIEGNCLVGKSVKNALVKPQSTELLCVCLRAGSYSWLQVRRLRRFLIVEFEKVNKRVFAVVSTFRATLLQPSYATSLATKDPLYCSCYAPLRSNSVVETQQCCKNLLHGGWGGDQKAFDTLIQSTLGISQKKNT